MNSLGGHCSACLLRLGFVDLETGTSESITEPAGLTSDSSSQAAEDDVAKSREGRSQDPNPDRIGRYKILQQIGEGGCGVVYLAEQEEPVRRRVALKVIKLGMDTKQVIARFEAERQALALMDHPNIARVLDAGATETGRPYFVMELVRGIRITDYCDSQKLSTRRRLELFIQVCQAIQHAHQKGIIHRDIKPSNVLVTERDGKPIPKIIDFGIAKATDQRLTEKTLFTAFNQIIGTPEYMSPEQAGLGGLDIDTRSDIYSLGVLLYELLTGQPPFASVELRRTAFEEVLRVIREKEPPRPSTRLTTLTAQELTAVAQRRQSEPAKLPGLLRRDLDWIVMKALEKDRSRRYDTANGFAMDLQRFLDEETVIARPPSQLYRLQKMMRRNKLAFAASAAVIGSLVAGLGLATWLFVRERSEAAKNQQVVKFLNQLLTGIPQRVNSEEDQRLLRKFLDDTARRVGKDLRDQPTVEADLRDTLGGLYQDLGAYREAEAMEREAVALGTRLYGIHSARTAYSLNRLALCLALEGKPGEAEIMHRSALSIQRKLLGNNCLDVASSLHNLAAALRSLGKLTEAESAMREALNMQRQFLGNDDLEVARSLAGLAAIICDTGRLPEAEDLERQGLVIRQRLLGEAHPDIALSFNNLAHMLRLEGKTREAESAQRTALAMQKKLLGADHPSVADSLSNLALILEDESNLAEAASLNREALEMRRRLFGNEDLAVARSMHNLAGVLLDQGKLAEAEPLTREALAVRRKLLGNEHLEVAYSLNNLASILAEQGDQAGAESLNREALAIRRKLLGNEHEDVVASLNNLASVLLDEDRLAEAEALYREAIEIERKLPANDRSSLAIMILNLAGLLRDLGRFSEAEAMNREALATLTKLLGDNHPVVATATRNLAAILADAGRLTEAEALHRQALALRRKQLGEEHPDVARSLHDLSWVLCRLHRFSEAEILELESLVLRRKLLGSGHPDVATSLENLSYACRGQDELTGEETSLRECLAIREQKLPEKWLTFSARSELGANLLVQKRFVESEALLLSGYQGLRSQASRIRAQDRYRLNDALQNLAQLYEVTNRPDQAAALRKQSDSAP
jgi:serine/threonine protein kinase